MFQDVLQRAPPFSYKTLFPLVVFCELILQLLTICIATIWTASRTAWIHGARGNISPHVLIATLLIAWTSPTLPQRSALIYFAGRSLFEHTLDYQQLQHDRISASTVQHLAYISIATAGLILYTNSASSHVYLSHNQLTSYHLEALCSHAEICTPHLYANYALDRSRALIHDVAILDRSTNRRVPCPVGPVRPTWIHLRYMQSMTLHTLNVTAPQDICFWALLADALKTGAIYPSNKGNGE